MLSNRAISIATRYWAAHLGRPPDDLLVEPCRVVTHGFELADYPGVFALFRGATATVSIPSGLAQPLRALLSTLSSGCTSATFASALSSISALVIGPAHIGYAETIAPPMHPVRSLGPNDAAAHEAFRESCNPIEWEHGGASIEYPCSGVFIDGQLVALAGYEIWGGTIAHVSVVTRPNFRNRGLGRSCSPCRSARFVSRPPSTIPYPGGESRFDPDIRVTRLSPLRHFDGSPAALKAALS
jgi:hypothetical protein